MTVVPPSVGPLLDELSSGVAATLGADLLGLYLFGSLVLGDFDPGRSDIDLLAVTTSAVTDEAFAGLDELHWHVTDRHPEWAGRLEVAYVPLAVLRDVRAGGEVARISPGEPFHGTPFLPHWVTDLYTVQQRGLTLHGPDPRDVLVPISREDFVETVLTMMASWGQWIEESARESFVGYAVLAVCRGLYALDHAAQCSKPAGAAYVAVAYPQWQPLVARALVWCASDSAVDNADAQDECRRLIAFAAARPRS